jgi:hypothetical protein
LTEFQSVDLQTFGCWDHNFEMSSRHTQKPFSRNKHLLPKQKIGPASAWDSPGIESIDPITNTENIMEGLRGNQSNSSTQNQMQVVQAQSQSSEEEPIVYQNKYFTSPAEVFMLKAKEQTPDSPTFFDQQDMVVNIGMQGLPMKLRLGYVNRIVPSRYIF